MRKMKNWNIGKILKLSRRQNIAIKYEELQKQISELQNEQINE